MSYFFSTNENEIELKTTKEDEEEVRYTFTSEIEEPAIIESDRFINSVIMHDDCITAFAFGRKST